MSNISFNAPLLLDGPTGTELQRRGFDTHLPLWSARALIEVPELVQQIHLEYIKAGADILTTNSFRTNRRVIERARLPARMAEELTRRSVELARNSLRQSGRSQVLIAGSDAPVEDCYSPELVPTDEELRGEHEEHIGWLVDAGCDLLLIETMNTLREARIASDVASESGLPFMVSVVTDPTGELILSGEPLSEGVRELGLYHPAAILTNCSAPGAVLRATEILATIKHEGKESWEFGGYPNSGEPDPVLGWEFVHTVPLNQFVLTAQKMFDLGARILGSCCGTTPEYTNALRGMMNV